MINDKLMALSGMIEDAPYELLRNSASENYLSNSELQLACSSCTCNRDCACKSEKLYLDDNI